ncbi:EscU/YscU/HrcU family type III secretion system export apparatus switch protein [Pseudomonas rubra]|uniref:EscU/YscU/HrcU family type III secretion system export apparatus switch protein n=1 Tax=Pseudomonas rubra TaxID=2942627 RepID=A0ABT5PCW0_9PSED|nr:EscU/YscU/HrcU family type III secretion system export apparatus switch protein [Pseudomonas rubra]MDD1016007.1 EscU/YscU/HrcU family type III secretion system export apparatus switch protein [Pseudomonas rubra]MDD1039222.1 EscU/YscU/HrcU family type III secretion system export apparatus switch protein [Pseudomonas rubra]MDD1155192.1 EscU/YscU/HrcU family type III secretion system export apparatus switch protein [Pseudomonas rubra]
MSSSASKSEKPTAKRLRDAARKGQTFKARDLLTSCMLLVGLALMLNDARLLEIMEVYRRLLAGGLEDDLARYSASLLRLALELILPMVLVCILGSALPALAQSGFRLASEALKLNLGALNPINGFKKLFSLRTVKDSIKALLYVLCFALALCLLWWNYRPLLFAQLHASPLALLSIWGELLLALFVLILGCVLVVVLLDALLEYWLFMREMKMDLHSVKREHKEQDGDPQIKGKRRQLHQELLNEQVRSDVRSSRMILANPTHIAIGIYFRPEVSLLPFISVIETNQRALAVRAYAEQVGVPVITDIQLARRIFQTHRRYSFLQVQEVEQVLRLLVWLEQVEQA